MKIRLSDSLVSFFETDLFELVNDAEAYGMTEEELVPARRLASIISPAGKTINIQTREDLRFLNDLSNSAEELSRESYIDPEQRAFYGRVSRSITTILVKGGAFLARG